MLIVRDAERRQRARALRAHGMTASTLDRDRGRAVGYDVIDVGHNFRMDELRAAMGLVQIERLLGWNEARRTLLAHYRGLLSERCRKSWCPSPTTTHLGPHHAGAVAGRGRPAA